MAIITSFAQPAPAKQPEQPNSRQLLTRLLALPRRSAEQKAVLREFLLAIEKENA